MSPDNILSDGRRSPSGYCRCILCGFRMARPPEVPCYLLRCPRCEAQMVDG